MRAIVRKMGTVMLSRNGSSFIGAVLAIFIIALGSETNARQKPPAGQPSPPVVKQGDPKLPAGDPCKLLTLAEVRNVFANAAIGTRDDDIGNGILRCRWRSPDGTVRLSLMDTEPGDSVEGELASYAMAFVTDIEKWNEAKPRITFQILLNVGDAAMLAIVAKDEVDPKYSLQAGAMLLARRRQQSILLEAPNLAARGRNAAYHALEELGRAAAKRM
jgi:hypothetical protein